MRNLESRVALVTGAGSGIGRSAARALSGAGATVVLADINAESAQTAADSIVAAGGVAIGVGADVGADEAFVMLKELILAREVRRV